MYINYTIVRNSPTNHAANIEHEFRTAAVVVYGTEGRTQEESLEGFPLFELLLLK